MGGVGAKFQVCIYDIYDMYMMYIWYINTFWVKRKPESRQRRHRWSQRSEIAKILRFQYSVKQISALIETLGDLFCLWQITIKFVIESQLKQLQNNLATAAVNLLVNLKKVNTSCGSIGKIHKYCINLKSNNFQIYCNYYFVPLKPFENRHICLLQLQVDCGQSPVVVFWTESRQCQVNSQWCQLVLARVHFLLSCALSSRQ